MSDIDPWVRILFLRDTATLGLLDVSLRRDEIVPVIADRIRASLARHDGSDITDCEILAESLFDELAAANALLKDEQPYAGVYYRYSKPRYEKFRDEKITSSKISLSANRIGSRFFPDVFAGYRASTDTKPSDFPSIGLAPGSDRVVSFSDNQITELDSATSALIDEVSSKNQIEGTPGLRELIIGQLKAGRELVRAGTFKAYLLQVTLVNTLVYLAERYEHDVIGNLAVELLKAIAQHVGIVP